MQKILFAAVQLCILLLCSCATPKNITYFQDVQNGEKIKEIVVNEIRIKPEDKLSIVVSTKDPAFARLFNLLSTNNRVGSSRTILDISTDNQNVALYTVDPNGMIDFPVLGKLMVAGMNRSELCSFIKQKLISEDLVKDPVVTVEYANTGVSILGEVGKPGRYDINRDRLSILDAISMAGDLTIHGMRKNVLVLRDENGCQVAYRLNLTDAETLFMSPAYYLQQNDIVYVEPNAMKKRQSTVNGNNVLSAPFWISVASFITSVAVLIFR